MHACQAFMPILALDRAGNPSRWINHETAIQGDSYRTREAQERAGQRVQRRQSKTGGTA